MTDNTWSGFQRLPALPEAVTKVTPAAGFTATSKTVTYTFNTSIPSTSYVLETYTGEKLWKKVTLAPSAKNPDAVTLTANIKDHSIGKYYT